MSGFLIQIFFLLILVQVFARGNDIDNSKYILIILVSMCVKSTGIHFCRTIQFEAEYSQSKSIGFTTILKQLPIIVCYRQTVTTIDAGRIFEKTVKHETNMFLTFEYVIYIHMLHYKKRICLNIHTHTLFIIFLISMTCVF